MARAGHGFAEDILRGQVLDFPEIANEVIHNLCEHLMALQTQIRWYENRLKLVTKEDARVRLLRTISGVGAVIASAIIASIGDGHQFSNGREFAAWLGLTPANKSGGGKRNWVVLLTLSGHEWGINTYDHCWSLAWHHLSNRPNRTRSAQASG